ncbi:helix-turn-helix domain-containing protein [Piscinibacter sakaiensis]|uniref:helix-turn-helix domain-containing protein n=1 Tax=Piscinibacter sakaiensis TaxID=1547922 RepID=UPI003AAD6FD5
MLLETGASFLQLDSPNHFMLTDEPAWARLVAAMHDFLPSPASHLGVFAKLTERERELLDFLARGLDNHQIAAHLGISEKTARNHVSSIFAKLMVESRSQAIVLAKDAGFGARQQPVC